MDIEQAALKIAHTLQTSLEVTRIIELFSEGLKSLIAHDGLAYEGHGTDRILIGQEAAHECSYTLKLQEHELGTVILSRSRAFSERETEELEQLFVILLYPLRNAFLYQQAIDAALTDPVTGVHNRAALDMLLGREVELARRHCHELSLLMVDIDRFKHINDTYGHLTGDVVLRRVADIISTCVRSSDVVTRYGGEEFIVMLRSTEMFGAALLAQRIRAAIERTLVRDADREVGVTVSIGVTSLHDEQSAHDLIDKADRALYEAKRQGRNRVVESAA